eukprot:1158580-Pelagomonas_calceolata.AAC.13
MPLSCKAVSRQRHVHMHSKVLALGEVDARGFGASSNNSPMSRHSWAQLGEQHRVERKSSALTAFIIILTHLNMYGGARSTKSVYIDGGENKGVLCSAAPQYEQNRMIFCAGWFLGLRSSAKCASKAPSKNMHHARGHFTASVGYHHGSHAETTVHVYTKATDGAKAERGVWSTATSESQSHHRSFAGATVHV